MKNKRSNVGKSLLTKRQKFDSDYVNACSNSNKTNEALYFAYRVASSTLSYEGKTRMLDSFLEKNASMLNDTERSFLERAKSYAHDRKADYKFDMLKEEKAKIRLSELERKMGFGYSHAPQIQIPQSPQVSVKPGFFAGLAKKIAVTAAGVLVAGAAISGVSDYLAKHGPEFYKKFKPAKESVFIGTKDQYVIEVDKAVEKGNREPIIFPNALNYHRFGSNTMVFVLGGKPVYLDTKTTTDMNRESVMSPNALNYHRPETKTMLIGNKTIDTKLEEKHDFYSPANTPVVMANLVREGEEKIGFYMHGDEQSLNGNKIN